MTTFACAVNWHKWNPWERILLETVVKYHLPDGMQELRKDSLLQQRRCTECHKIQMTQID